MKLYAPPSRPARMRDEHSSSNQAPANTKRDASSPDVFAPKGSDPIRVAFELTPLGSARYYPRNRTGIFRVCAEMLTALSKREDIDLLLTSAMCRGEAQEEVDDLGLPTRVHRSALDRAVYPLAKRLLIPSWVTPGVALSERRRKLFRTLIQSLEYFGGHPREIQTRASVCHSPYYPPSRVGWTTERRATRILTVHDVLPLTHPQFFPRSDQGLIREVLSDVQSGAIAHCVSEFTRTELLKQVPEAEPRTFVAPLAARRDFFFPRNSAAVSALCARLSIERPYILCLGTLDPRKNIKLALEAFDRLPRDSRIQLVIAGAAARNAPSFEELSAPYPNARANCVLTGFVSDHDLPALYSGATMALFPSLAEGFGLPALEAMSCGAPLVASNTTSLPEVIGPAGLVLDPQDSLLWTEAISRLLDSPEERARLSAAGIERSRTYSWSRTADALARAYHRFGASER